MTPGEPVPEYLRDYYRRLFAEWDREFAAKHAQSEGEDRG